MGMKSSKKPVQPKTRSRQSTRLTALVKRFARARKSLRIPQMTTAQVIVAVVICATAAAMLIAARQRSQQDVATLEAPPEENVQLDAVRAVAASDTTTAVAIKRPNVRAVKPANATTDGVRVESAPVDSPTKAVSVESAKAPTDDVTVQSDIKEHVTTITGCLDLDHETFRLTDTDGFDAPKSRSWKSGFLTKRSTSVELVDSANTLKLANYVGQRVAATGMLANREMQMLSLRRVAASCT